MVDFLLLNNQTDNYHSPKDSDHSSPWKSFCMVLWVGEQVAKIKVLRKREDILLTRSPDIGPYSHLMCSSWKECCCLFTISFAQQQYSLEVNTFAEIH